MKFTQIALGKYAGAKGPNYTLFALGEDGRVYKSVFKKNNGHEAWLALSDEVILSLPAPITEAVPVGVTAESIEQATAASS